MPYHALPCNIMQYHAITCNTMQYHAIPCYRVAEVAREHGWNPPKSLDSDENFKPEHTLFYRKLSLSRFTHFLEIFGQKKCLFWSKNDVILKIVKNPSLPLCDVERKDHHQFSSSSRYNSCAISLIPQEYIYLNKIPPFYIFYWRCLFFKMPSCAGKNKRKGVHVEEFLSPQKKSKNKSKERGIVEVLTPHWREHWGKRFPAPMLAIASRWTFSFIALIVLFLRFDEKKTLFAKTSHSW